MNNQHREAQAPENVLPEVSAEPKIDATVLPWRGRGNIISAAGTFLVDLLEQA